MRNRRRTAWLTLVLALVSAVHGLTLAIDLTRMRETMEKIGDDHALARFDAWRELVQDLKAASEAHKLQQVNDFFNQSTRFTDDAILWGQEDYWATPLEQLAEGAGDCEDFVLAKYFTLQELGVPVNQMRLTYVRAVIAGSARGSVAHMVLAYYPTAQSDPLVLDNLVHVIQPASARADLHPVFSFNAEGIWSTPRANPAPVDRLSRWKNLVIRMRNQGHEF